MDYNIFSYITCMFRDTDKMTEIESFEDSEHGEVRMVYSFLRSNLTRKFIVCY